MDVRCFRSTKANSGIIHCSTNGMYTYCNRFIPEDWEEILSEPNCIICRGKWLRRCLDGYTNELGCIDTDS